MVCMAGMLDIVQKGYGIGPQYAEVMAGVPEGYQNIRTIRDLLDIGYRAVGAREQMRQNLMRIIDTEATILYDKIVGFDKDVIPAIDRAILAGHDMVLVGQMGQAKTRIAQIIAEGLLSPMPVIRGSPINDVPTELPA